MVYYAHISEGGRKQTVEAHLRSVASLTSEALSGIGLSSLGYLTGLVHDIGKYTTAFQSYLCRATAGEYVKRGSVNHTFAGTVFLWERFHGSTNSYGRLVCELMCCAAGSHHGLFDCLSPDGKSGFLQRLSKNRDELMYDEALQAFLSQCATESETDALFSAAVCEMQAAFPTITSFKISVLERMLTSALIDADRTDTAAFMSGKRETAPSLRSILPIAYRSVESAIGELQAKSEADEAIRKARGVISGLCLRFAEKPVGIYRLNVPTGAGKTAACLRYALASALHKENIRHIFYIAPLLTVLEQNADEIRRFVGERSWVLEHHSNVVFDRNRADELALYELLAERWDAPVIVTTLVQLLNTFFSSKTSCVRRMNALCNSILIIDEVQSLPIKTISLFNGVIDFLAKHCGTTVILCSATQPGLEDKCIGLRLDKAQDMVPFDHALWEPFKRVNVIDARTQFGMTEEELAMLAENKAKAFGSVLIICNTRKSAAKVYSAVKAAVDSSVCVKHLSASMCRMHRKQCLDELIGRLSSENGEATVCVSTQLIEAGVDISFGCVIRTLAGLDSIVQSAGRCNRHGELKRAGKAELGQLIIVNSRNENTSFLKEIKHAQNASTVLLDDYMHDPGRYDGELFGEKAVNAYYSQLYLETNAAADHSTEYPIHTENGVTTALALLSKNEKSQMLAPEEARRLKAIMHQAFKTVGDGFEVFDESSSAVIVPYDETAVDMINALCLCNSHTDMKRAEALIQQAKPYTVTVYDGMKRKLEEAGALLTCCDGSVITVNPTMAAFYDRELGLTIPEADGQAYII